MNAHVALPKTRINADGAAIMPVFDAFRLHAGIMGLCKAVNEPLHKRMLQSNVQRIETLKDGRLLLTYHIPVTNEPITRGMWAITMLKDELQYIAKQQDMPLFGAHDADIIHAVSHPTTTGKMEVQLALSPWLADIVCKTYIPNIAARG